MSGYRDTQGRFRRVAPGTTTKGHFAECEICGYLGAPHEPEVCERNKAWDAKRQEAQAGNDHQPHGEA